MLTFRKGIIDGMPIALGYLSISFAFGILALERGLPFWSPILMSLINFTGTGQFAGIDLISSNAALGEVALTLLVINIRYLLMSVTLSQHLPRKLPFWQRLFIGFGNTDEVFAVAIGQKSTLPFAYLSSLILTSYLGWNLGTLLGAVAGSTLPEILRKSLGISLYGMFIAILVPAARQSSPILKVILIALISSCLLNYLPLFSFLGDGFIIIICGVLAAAIAAYLFPLEMPKKQEEECNL